MNAKNLARMLVLVCVVMPVALQAQQPRQLSEAELARIQGSVQKSKANAAQQAEQQRQRAELERQQAALRRQQDALSNDDEDWEDDEPQSSSGGGFANVLDAFTNTLSSEMAKKQQEDAQRQRFLDNVRRQAEAIDRQRQRELEQQRLAEERARLERQAQQQRQQQAIAQQQRQSAASSAGGTAATAASATSGSTGNTLTTQQQAAKAREEALRANVTAERKRLAEERERTAAAERERVMRPFVEASNRQQALATTPATPASVFTTPKPVAEARDYGPAKAWCRARRNEMAKQTEYQCMGPLQNLLSWYPTLDAPLGMAGCPGGEGYTPTPEHGGSSFNCGRKLKVGDLRMPTYDPYRGGGNPVRVTTGN
jgi:hypothetical protein